MDINKEQGFNYSPSEIARYIYCSTTRVFSIRLENGKTIYHESSDPDQFLNWLRRYKIPLIARRF